MYSLCDALSSYKEQRTNLTCQILFKSRQNLFQSVFDIKKYFKSHRINVSIADGFRLCLSKDISDSHRIGKKTPCVHVKERNPLCDVT